MFSDSIQWLKSNQNIWDRQKIGNHKYLNDREKKQLQSIAKEIDPVRHFTIYGCEKCIQALIQFVYTEFDNEQSKPKAEEIKQENDSSTIQGDIPVESVKD